MESRQQDLQAILRSRVPLVIIETRDEARAAAQVLDLASRTSPPTPVFEWAVTQGLRRLDVDFGPQYFNADPTRALTHIAAAIGGIYLLLDFHPYLTEPHHVRMLKDICLSYDQCPRTIVLVSHRVQIPPELEHLAAWFQLAFPDREQRRAIVDRVALEWANANGTQVRADEESIRLLVENLGGLSVTDTERLARAAIYNDGAISRDDAPTVMKAKYDLLGRGGVLSFEYETAGLADLAGMARLKEWLRLRRAAFDGSAPELDPPRGLLLLGVQGCGKSLAAKVAAEVLGVPLLRMDVGAVHDKYVGESERKLRESLQTADVMAPCVLWIDEIEKAFAAGDDDGGASQRVLGTFLTWLAEKRGRVFVVATANDISRLPPELVRKGRFDEIFFVDLPDEPTRAEVLRIHATARGIELTEAEVAELATASAGFSGAEIEQAIVSAAYAAHADQTRVRAEHVAREIAATRPLSVVMAERVAALRQWASTRAVGAD